MISSRRLFTVVLNLAGLAAVGLDLAGRSLHGAPALIAGAAWAAWALWAVAVALGERFPRTRAGVLVAMLAGGSFVAATTDVVGFVPAMVALLMLSGDPAVSLKRVAALLAGAVALLGLGALVDPAPWAAVLGVLSAMLICSLGGLARRQRRAADEQSRALLEERVAVERERALVATLTERSRIARDLHDVLAHSLGGLVIQLEVVDALLESGRAEEARDRVVAARELAVSGLDEAKQAVTALRADDDVTDLFATHRELGGELIVHGSPEQGQLSVLGRTALRRAVQELLTNSRKHAPGATVTLRFAWADDGLTVTATTPPGPSTRGVPSVPGGGHGLAGMRERVTAAGGSMEVRPGPPFAVQLQLPRAAA